MKNFFNTITLSGSNLKKAVEQAESQNEKIKAIFEQKNISTGFTPAEMHKEFEKLCGRTPITSIRRAITVLTESGQLIKTEQKRKGAYDMDNFVWKLKK